jgi:hypothetical protein
VTAQDLGQCAPVVSAGRAYAVSIYFKSSVRAALVVFYRAASGDWRYLATSHPFAATGRWTSTSFTTPPMPSGAVAISFGPRLITNGTLTADDACLVDRTAPGAHGCGA